MFTVLGVAVTTRLIKETHETSLKIFKKICASSAFISASNAFSSASSAFSSAFINQYH